GSSARTRRIRRTDRSRMSRRSHGRSSESRSTTRSAPARPTPRSRRSSNRQIAPVPARANSSLDQGDLFGAPSALPEGMRYAPDVITPGEEQALAAELAGLPFREFEFHGFLGRRRTVSFGWRYDFRGGGLEQAGGIPDFLAPV